jgi:hypothetical protein
LLLLACDTSITPARAGRRPKLRAGLDIGFGVVGLPPRKITWQSSLPRVSSPPGPSEWYESVRRAAWMASAATDAAVGAVLETVREPLASWRWLWLSVVRAPIALTRSLMNCGLKQIEKFCADRRVALNAAGAPFQPFVDAGCRPGAGR